MAKPMNMKRRLKALETLEIAPRDPVALAMLLRRGDGRHPDQKKEGSRRACRGKVRDDG